MIDPKNVARQAKLFVDKGLDTQGEALDRLNTFRVVISIDERAATTREGQVAFATALATAARCFIGGVYYSGKLGVPTMTPLLTGCATLEDAARHFGAAPAPSDLSAPEIVIGLGDESQKYALRATSEGWIAACQPASQLDGRGLSGNVIASSAAAAICVGNAFRFVTGDEQAIYKREAISLWSPEDVSDRGPALTRFIDKLWLAGLGNLGQAFLWTIGALELSDPERLCLLLQDFDRISDENWGTSLLADGQSAGQLKTFVAEQWCTARKVDILRVDRRIDEDLRWQAGEPAVALSGLDKIEPRKALGAVGFLKIVDVGLGATHSDYTKVRINTFDQQNSPDKHFVEGERKGPDLAALGKLKGYKGLDRCGMEEYAGHSIAYTFVSVIAAALAIAQCVRICLGDAPYRSIVLDTADLRTARVVAGEKPARPLVGNVALN